MHFWVSSLKWNEWGEMRHEKILVYTSSNLYSNSADSPCGQLLDGCSQFILSLWPTSWWLPSVWIHCSVLPWEPLMQKTEAVLFPAGHEMLIASIKKKSCLNNEQEETSASFLDLFAIIRKCLLESLACYVCFIKQLVVLDRELVTTEAVVHHLEVAVMLQCFICSPWVAE